MLLEAGKEVLLDEALLEIVSSRGTVIVVSALHSISYKIHTIFSDQALDEKVKTLFRVFSKNDSIG